MQNANKAKLSEMQRLLEIMAQLRDPGPEDLERVLGERRFDRFGAAFLDVLAEAD